MGRGRKEREMGKWKEEKVKIEVEGGMGRWKEEKVKIEVERGMGRWREDVMRIEVGGNGEMGMGMEWWGMEWEWSDGMGGME